MTVQTALELKFADGDYLFALPLPQLRELQRVCGNVGIFSIYGRVMKGRYILNDASLSVPEDSEAFIDDIIETIRLALIGGGRAQVGGEEVAVSAIRARQLVDTYCYPAAPLRESWSVAAAVLAACIEGFEPPDAKKKARPARGEKRPKRSSTSTSSPTTVE